MPPLASLGGVTPVVRALTILGSALAPGLAYLAVLKTRTPELDEAAGPEPGPV